MKNLRLAFVACWAVASAFADTITIDGITHEDVYVREGGTRYFVQIPSDGRTISIQKDKVKPEDVTISTDAAYREELSREWRRNSARRRAGLAPDNGASADATASTPTAADPAAAVTTEARVLHFPADRSIGYLKLRDASIPRVVDTYYYWFDQMNWHYFALAKGDVAIPAGKLVSLHLNVTADEEESPFAGLEPNDLYWVYFEGYNMDFPPGDEALRHLSALTGVRKLDLRSSAVTDRGMAYLPAFSQLERITLPSNISDAGFAHVAALTSLEGLYFCKNTITDAGLAPLEALPFLKEVRLGGEVMTNGGLAHLAQARSLDYLMLFGDGFTDAGMATLSRVPSLRVLNVGNRNLTDDGVRHIAALPNLEILSLYNNPAITGRGLAYLRAMPRLRQLDLNDRAGIDSALRDDDMVHVKALRNLERLDLPSTVADEGLAYVAELKGLKRLWACTDGKGRLSDTGLDHISRLPELEHLSISGGEGITDKGLGYLARLPRLAKLHVMTTSDKVTGAGLAHLAGMESLTELDISLHLRNPPLTVSGVSQLNALTSLQKLNVYGVSRDDSALDLSALTQLEELSVSVGRESDQMRDEDLACLAGLTKLRWLQGVRGISDAGMAHLAGLNRLERLNIGGPGLTDTGLQYLRGMSMLESLTIDGIFSEEGLVHLEGLTSLRRLAINGLGSVREGALERLRESLPNLNTFNINTG